MSEFGARIYSFTGEMPASGLSMAAETLANIQAYKMRQIIADVFNNATAFNHMVERQGSRWSGDVGVTGLYALACIEVVTHQRKPDSIEVDDPNCSTNFTAAQVRLYLERIQRSIRLNLAENDTLPTAFLFRLIKTVTRSHYCSLRTLEYCNHLRANLADADITPTEHLTAVRKPHNLVTIADRVRITGTGRQPG